MAAAPDAVPATLAPWTEWVLHDTPDAKCPRVDGFGERACVFASSLLLAIDDAQASFKIDVAAYRKDAPLPLPGHAGAWPEDVRLDGKLLPRDRHAWRPAGLPARRPPPH